MTLHNIFVVGDDGVKEWFRQYIRLNQHKVGGVHQMRGSSSCDPSICCPPLSVPPCVHDSTQLGAPAPGAAPEGV